MINWCQSKLFFKQPVSTNLTLESNIIRSFIENISFAMVKSYSSPVQLLNKYDLFVYFCQYVLFYVVCFSIVFIEHIKISLKWIFGPIHLSKIALDVDLVDWEKKSRHFRLGSRSWFHLSRFPLHQNGTHNRK